MKNILVNGITRAGKSSLAKRIRDEFQYNAINGDHLIHAFAQAFPQMGIDCNGDYWQVAANVTPFTARLYCLMAQHANCKTGSKFVAEATFFDYDMGIPLMEEMLQSNWGLKLLDEFLFIILHDSRTSEKKYNDIRKYDTPEDWTYTWSDDDLRKYCDSLMKPDDEFHNKFYTKWKDYGFWVHDVAEGREKVFDRIINELKRS